MPRAIKTSEGSKRAASLLDDSSRLSRVAWTREETINIIASNSPLKGLFRSQTKPTDTRADVIKSYELFRYSYRSSSTFHSRYTVKKNPC